MRSDDAPMEVERLGLVFCGFVSTLQFMLDGACHMLVNNSGAQNALYNAAMPRACVSPSALIGIYPRAYPITATLPADIPSYAFEPRETYGQG